MFALATLVTLGALGTYLYASLAQELKEQDDEELVTTLEAARHRLRATDSAQMVREQPFPFQNLAGQRENLVLILRSVEGETLLEIHPVPDPLPLMKPVAADMAPTVEGLSDWRLGDGSRSRAGAVYGRLANGTDQVEIIAALTSGERIALLARYRMHLIEAAFSGAVIVVLLSLLLIRAGLRPLRRIALEAASVTVNRLQTRLDAASAPLELQELVTAINGMLDRIEDGFQRLSQFSADVAHDLRTPISNLLGQTQVTLNKPRTPEEYQSLLASNVEEFERLSRMVENMLFLARADNAQVALRKERFDVRDELARVAEYFQGMVEEGGVSILIGGDYNDADASSGKVELVADPSLLRRALHNLLANAIRYTPRGGSIRLDVLQRGGEVAVSVSNPGPGIEPEHLPHLFDRFYRADPARSDSAFSAGLGLAIVQSIARLHGGRVEVESRPKEVTIFRLVFPAAARQ
jgi:two-component system heavy metal sensor histidine kinase CusS